MSKNVWVRIMYVVVPLIALGLGVVIGAAVFGGDKAGTDAAATQAAASQAAATAAPEPTVQASMAADVNAPKGATDTGGIAKGAESATVTVDVYFDYMCPYCGKFETANGASLDQLAESGQIRLVQHPLSFLDQASNGTNYSTRAANAFATAANADIDAALAFSTALFNNQPAEGTEGLSDDKIAELAKAAGVPDAAVADFAAKTFDPWVAAATQYAFNGPAKVSGTPSVYINGTKFDGDLYTAGPVEQAITQALKG